MRGLLCLVVGLGLMTPLPATAQQRTAAKGSGPAAAEKVAEPELNFEREYYVYPARVGRDPFAALSAQSGSGPSFEDLSLQGVIFSEGNRSVALLNDRDGRIYRVRRGQVVGNARVVNISLKKVVFAVESFGIVRQEELELKRNDMEGGQP